MVIREGDVRLGSGIRRCPGDADTATADRYDRPRQILSMPVQQIGHQRNSPAGGNIWQPKNPCMRRTEQVHQCPEVTVDRYKNTPFLRRRLKQGHVPRVRPLFPGGPHIVALCLQPRSESLAGTSIDQEPQMWATTTSSSRSLASTAWA
jgi:hypothetical protein